MISRRKGDLSSPGLELPKKWCSYFDVVNINKVLHFLNETQTVTLTKNVRILCKPGAYVCVSVLTPTKGEPEWDEFLARLEKNGRAPDSRYYDLVTDITTFPPSFLGISFVSVEERTRQTPNLTHPGQKTTFFTPEGLYMARQGQHYHTFITLMSYFQEGFELVDNHITKDDPTSWYLSVLLRRSSL